MTTIRGIAGGLKATPVASDEIEIQETADGTSYYTTLGDAVLDVLAAANYTLTTPGTATIASTNVVLDNAKFYQVKQSTGSTVRSLLGFSTDTVLVGATTNALTLQASGIDTLAKVEISNGSIALNIGADSGASTRTDATNKVYRFTAQHFTNVEEPLGLMHGTNTTSVNQVFIGGGTASCNTATNIAFYTAATNTTVTGTKVLDLTLAASAFTNPVTLASGSATVAALAIEAAITTTGNLISVGGATQDTTLTTGSLAVFSSNSPDLGTRSLVKIIQDHVTPVAPTCLLLQNDGAGAADAGAYFKFNNTPVGNTNGATSTFKTGGTVSGSLKINVDGTTYFILYQTAPTS